PVRAHPPRHRGGDGERVLPRAAVHLGAVDDHFRRAPGRARVAGHRRLGARGAARPRRRGAAAGGPLVLRYSPPMETVADLVQAGTPVLRARARDLTPEELATPWFRKLVATMVATMRAAPGVGLAAPQIGVPLRVFVAEDPADRGMAKLSEEERRGRRPAPPPPRPPAGPALPAGR